MTRYIIGLLFIALGVMMIIKTDWLLSAFGRVAWAENKLGAEGGTRIFYKLLGFAFIVFAFMLISGKVFGILDWIFVRDSSV